MSTTRSTHKHTLSAAVKSSASARTRAAAPVVEEDKQVTHRLFCYGSNHPRQLAERIGEPLSMAAAYAPGHKRVFRDWSKRWEGGVASLIPATERPAYGYVAEVTDEQLSLMDKFEGVAGGSYRRMLISVVVKGKRGKAIAYVSMSKEFNAPSDAYLLAVTKTIGAFWSIAGPQSIVIARDSASSVRTPVLAALSAARSLTVSAAGGIALADGAPAILRLLPLAVRKRFTVLPHSVQATLVAIVRARRITPKQAEFLLSQPDPARPTPRPEAVSKFIGSLPLAVGAAFNSCSMPVLIVITRMLAP